MAAEVVAAVDGMTVEQITASQMGMKALGAGIAVGLTGIGTGVAEMGIGSAAVGAVAENKDYVRSRPALHRYSGNHRHLRSGRRPPALVRIITRQTMGSEVKEQEVCPNCGYIHSGQDGNIGLDALVKEIREKGRAEAEKVKAEAKADSDQILAAAGKRSETIKLTAEAEVQKQTSHIVSQEVSAANLLVKRELLNTQKALLDQVYEATRKEILALPESFHREAIRKLLTRCKNGDPGRDRVLQCPRCRCLKGRHRRQCRVLEVQGRGTCRYRRGHSR